jgi:hypothetical protein
MTSLAPTNPINPTLSMGPDPARRPKNRLARRDATFADMVYYTANDFARADHPYQLNPVNGV